MERIRRARFRSKWLRKPLTIARHRGLRAHDAFVVSYPRSGTTWTLFMLREVLTGTPVTFSNLPEAVPYVGKQKHAPPLLPERGRLIWSHEVVDLGARRVVYLVRDPRSVVLSEYRMLLMAGLFTRGFDSFLHDFLRGKSNPWGAWNRHVLHWLDHPQRASGPLMVVRYEDMHQNPDSVLRDILSFLGRPTSDQLIDEVVANNRLDAMRRKEGEAALSKSRSDLAFIGDGGVALWRETLSHEATRRIEVAFGDVMAVVGYHR